MRNKLLKLAPIFFLAIFGLIFSTWLTFHTFQYSNGNILIGAKAWSDFSWTIPMIRSFSFGHNFPVEAPLFPGEPIHYHFLFYTLVGLLEKAGLRLDFALNIPSIIFFTSFLVMIFLFSKRLFDSNKVAFLSVFFSLFNGTFSFIYFFKTHPLSTTTLMDIVGNNTFSSFGPYDGKLVTAFWNLNIYTNQRHFAGALAISLAVIYVFLSPVFSKRKTNFFLKNILIGVMLGLMFYFHLAILLMTLITIFLLTILFKNLRASGIIILSITAVICIPQYIYLNSSGSNFNLTFHPGYLTANNFTLVNFITHWIMNLGLNFFLIPIAFVFTNLKQKKVFLAFFASFIIGNLFQFSPDIAGNHKFFNYFMIIGIMFPAFFLVKLWKNIFLKPVVLILAFFLILSGIIDFFPIINDAKITLADYPKKQTIKWVMDNTPPDSIFLNSTYLYPPESLAGRKVFLGWPYFAWSAGYNTSSRSKTRDMMLSTNSKKELCRLLHSNNISYIEINASESGNRDQPVFSDLFNKFVLEHENDGIKIYNASKSCVDF